MWTAARKYPSLDSNSTKGRFDGRVVVVAGGASGIGRAAAERFANDGAHVYIIDISLQDEEDLKQKYDNRVISIKQDVTDSEGLKGKMAEIAGRHGGSIHTIVNSAVYFGSKGITAEKEDWMRSLEVNVVGYANTVQACVPYMSKGKNCSIINLSSISAHRAQPNRWTYTATKGAISSMTRSMALDLCTKEIRANTVSPGYTWSPEGAKARPDREEGEKTWKHLHLVEATAEVEQIAAVIVFLASRDASYINGADIPVCGGYLAMGPERRGDDSKFAGINY